jgi:hypothetical protein
MRIDFIRDECRYDIESEVLAGSSTRNAYARHNRPEHKGSEANAFWPFVFVYECQPLSFPANGPCLAFGRSKSSLSVFSSTNILRQDGLTHLPDKIVLPKLETTLKVDVGRQVLMPLSFCGHSKATPITAAYLIHPIQQSNVLDGILLSRMGQREGLNTGPGVKRKSPVFFQTGPLSSLSVGIVQVLGLLVVLTLLKFYSFLTVRATTIRYAPLNEREIDCYESQWVREVSKSCRFKPMRALVQPGPWSLPPPLSMRHTPTGHIFNRPPNAEGDYKSASGSGLGTRAESIEEQESFYRKLPLTALMPKRRRRGEGTRGEAALKSS